MSEQIEPTTIRITEAATRLGVTVDDLVGLIQRRALPGLVFGKRERRGVIPRHVVEAIEAGERELPSGVLAPTNRELASRAARQEQQLACRPEGPRPAVLYRAFDATGQLLYVGISLRAPERMHQHQRDKPWWTEVACITLEHHATIKSAEQAETDAIVADKPRYNIAKTNRQPRPAADKRFFSFVGRWNAYQANAMRESRLRLSGDHFGAQVARELNMLVIQAQRQHLAECAPRPSPLTSTRASPARPASVHDRGAHDLHPTTRKGAST